MELPILKKGKPQSIVCLLLGGGITSGKLKLFAHTHVDGGPLVASKDDRDFLKTIGQNSSIVVSACDGHELEFSISLFNF